MTELHAVDLVRRALGYQRDNLLVFIGVLDDECLDSKPFDGALSIHETLLHLARCYEFYTTSAMKGTMDPAPYKPPAYHSTSELNTLIKRVCEAASGRMAAWNGEFLAGTVTYEGRAVARGDLLAEMVVHAQHHIGQLQLTLRLIGREPAPIRFLV
ncbi:MAG: DinB family protein [Planctomycetota bacterium]